VITRDRGVWFLGGRASRRTWYVIAGANLRTLVEPEEVGLSRGSPWPEIAFLLTRPDAEVLARTPREQMLLVYWSRLFRARARSELQRAIASQKLDNAQVAARRRSIGLTEFAEARSVLELQGLVLPSDGDVVVYCEFAAAFLDAFYFAPHLLAHTFPAIDDRDAVARLLGSDLDGMALLAATQPAGAPALRQGHESDLNDADASDSLHSVSLESREGGEETNLRESDSRRAPQVGRLTRVADAAARRGNDVRAAMLYTRSARNLGAEAAGDHRARARGALKQLAERLQRALFIRKGEAELWAEALTPLLRRASQGFWRPEARLLYDLQKVCVDHEREIFTLDTLGWLFSLGRHPLKRPLPHLREVMMSKHLRTAARRLPKVTLARDDRVRLESLLDPAVHIAEHDLRERFRPWIFATLEATWVQPQNAPERVAYNKLVEELLDPIVSRGFSTLGDFRDSASRSHLKMPDLSGPAELFRGDRLLMADQSLASSLEGVHRSSEIYMRALQRLSALAFGTRVGRFVTLFAALPFGGAFVALKGLEEIDHLFLSRLTGKHHHLVNPSSVCLLGLLALAMINFTSFRRQFLAAVTTLVWFLRAVFVRVPVWILGNPLFRRVLTSPASRFFWHWLLKPVVVAIPAWLVARQFTRGPSEALGTGIAAFLVASFLFNTRDGRRLEQLIIDQLGEAGRVFFLEIVPGAIRFVIWAFEQVIERMERVLYAVDEWLRFKAGQSGTALVGKAVLGLLWGVVAYLVRFYVNLLIEPQVNPIKHFPVVTVSHKVMLPFLGSLTRFGESVLTPIFGTYLGWALSWINVLLIPGIFGFLVWELKSNWRLYAANRSRTLEPEIVGSHGETVVRLLRPGFHSGTLPKLFARLRRAERSRGRETAALKRRDALHHVEQSFRRFVERDVVALLRESQTPSTAEVSAGSIRLATNRIRLELITPDEERQSLLIDLIEHEGMMIAGVARAGWAADLTRDARGTLADALVGFFKMSGVELAFPRLDVDSLDEVGTHLDSLTRQGKVVAMNHVVLTWTDWVATWGAKPADSRSERDAVHLVDVLPPRERTSVPEPSASE
jgi:hypothetical protein